MVDIACQFEYIFSIKFFKYLENPSCHVDKEECLILDVKYKLKINKSLYTSKPFSNRIWTLLYTMSFNNIH